MRSVVAFAIVFCVSMQLVAQGTYVPLQSQTYDIIDRYDIKYSKWIPLAHTSVKPYNRGTIASIGETLTLSGIRFNRIERFYNKYLTDDNSEWLDSIKSTNMHKLWIFYREPASFLHYSMKSFSIKVNPVLAFRLGGDLNDKRFIFNNSRGAEIRFDIKRIVDAYFFISENQEIPLNYVNEKVVDSSYAFVPGDGYWKLYKTNGVDYLQARGYVNINVLKYFNVQFGHDKNFIGDGIRSMFLSDNANAYLFMKLNTRVWRINYQNIFAELISNYKRGGDKLLPKKYAAFHHLNFNVYRGIDIGFFEGVIFAREKHFEFQYLNPIIFYRSIEQAVGSPDNAVLGFNLKANFLYHAQIYGQFLLDEFNFKQVSNGRNWWANKWSYQIGAKYIDVIPNLDLQFEANVARPFIYTHSLKGADSIISNYTHYNQALAHPLGANFIELLFNAHYQVLGQLGFNLRYSYANYGEDYLIDSTGKVSHLGHDINKITSTKTITREYDNYQSQGMKAHQHFIQLLASYQPWHNVYIELEFLYRNKNSQIDARDSETIYLGLNARWNFNLTRYNF